MWRLVAKLFEIQNTVVARINPYWAGYIRTQTPLGHFHKWYLGDGQNCFWCKQVRKHPWLAWIIPYSYGFYNKNTSHIKFPDMTPDQFLCVLLYAKDRYIGTHNLEDLWTRLREDFLSPEQADSEILSSISIAMSEDLM